MLTAAVTAFSQSVDQGSPCLASQACIGQQRRADTCRPDGTVPMLCSVLDQG